NTTIVSTAPAQSQTARGDRYAVTDLGSSANQTVPSQPRETILWFNQQEAAEKAVAAPTDNIVGLEQKKKLIVAYGGTHDGASKIDTLRKKVSVEGTQWAFRNSSPETAVASDGHELVYNQKHWKDFVPKRERPSHSGDRYNPIVENPFVKAEGG